MCKAKRMTRSELDERIIGHAARHAAQYEGLKDQLGSMAYERFMRKRQAKLAKEAGERMNQRIERALRFMPEVREAACDG